MSRPRSLALPLLLALVASGMTSVAWADEPTPEGEVVPTASASAGAAAAVAEGPEVAPIDGMPSNALDPSLFPDEAAADDEAAVEARAPEPRLRNGYLQAGVHFALRGPPAADYGLGLGIAGGALLGGWHRRPSLPSHQLLLGGSFQWTIGFGDAVSAQYDLSSYFLFAADLGLMVRAGVGARPHGYLGIAWMPAVGIRFGKLQSPLSGSSSLRQAEADFHPVGLHMMGGARRGRFSYGAGFRLLIRGTWDVVFQLDVFQLSWGL